METFDRVQALPLMAMLSWPTFEKESCVSTPHAEVCEYYRVIPGSKASNTSSCGDPAEFKACLHVSLTWNVTCHHSRRHEGKKTCKECEGNVYPWAPTREECSVAWNIYPQEGCRELCSEHRCGSHKLRETSWTSFLTTSQSDTALHPCAKEESEITLHNFSMP